MMDLESDSQYSILRLHVSRNLYTYFTYSYMQLHLDRRSFADMGSKQPG
jgi:hypothetical protein